MLRFTGLAGVAAAVAPTLAACGGPASTNTTGDTAKSVTAVIGYGNNQTWDPLQTASAFSMAAMLHCYESLVEGDQLTRKPYAGLATWHDGKPVTADDVVFTYARALDPKENVLVRTFLAGWLKEVRKTGEHEVEFVLAKPFPYALQRIQAVKIVPKHVFDGKWADAVAGKVVGSGPYQVVEQAPLSHTRFERFAGYNGPADRPAGAARPRDGVRVARHPDGPEDERPDHHDVPRPDRRGGTGERGAGGDAPPVHAGAVLRDAEPTTRRGTHCPQWTSTVRDSAAERLRLPHPLLEGNRGIRAAVDLPLVAYDIPGSVVAKLPTDVVVTLAGDGTLAGLKDSSGDLDGLRAVLESASVPGFRCFSGSETLADLGLFIGAHGLVPGIGNVDPHGYLRLFAAAGQADWDTARTEQSRLRRLFRLVNVGGQRMGGYSSAIGAFKEGLVARGVIAHATTSEPMIPLNDTERAVVRRHLDEAGLL